MGIRQETKALLDGVVQRMKLVNIAKFIVGYTFKEQWRDMVPNKDYMDFFVMATLDFIKERTLGSERTCHIEDVENFMDEIAASYPECHLNGKRMARAIVYDILQRGGILESYALPGSKAGERMHIRVIEEEDQQYHLTDDAFDFLFRTKEIESALDYSVIRFRMFEYMKRDNYEEALGQSRELVSKIRSMKIGMDDFIRRCRNDIANIPTEQYGKEVEKIRNLLDMEEKELRVIQDSAKERALTLLTAEENGIEGEDLQRHVMALREIVRNIQTAIAEQRSLINKKTEFASKYQEILVDAMAFVDYERLNFKQEILNPLQNGLAPLSMAAAAILAPISKPMLPKMLCLENLYDIHVPEECVESKAIVMDYEENEMEKALPLRSKRYLEITTALFGYMQTKENFKVSEFISSLDDDTLYDFCKEDALPFVLLTLYDMRDADIAAWRAEGMERCDINGEFSLPWCLGEMPEKVLEGLAGFCIERTNRSFSFTIKGEEGQKQIEMSDLCVTVRRIS